MLTLDLHARNLAISQRERGGGVALRDFFFPAKYVLLQVNDHRSRHPGSVSMWTRYSSVSCNARDGALDRILHGMAVGFAKRAFEELMTEDISTQGLDAIGAGFWASMVSVVTAEAVEVDDEIERIFTAKQQNSKQYCH